MNALDLDPNYGLPLWQALVRYFRAYPPLVQAPQQLELPLPKGEQRIAANAHAGKHGRAGSRSRVCGTPQTPAQDVQAGLFCEAGSTAKQAAREVASPPRPYLPKALERRLPIQPSP